MRLFAPAKVNLGLSVTGRLENGYHTLESLFVPLTVGDELEVSPSDKLALKVLGADLPGDQRNLVYRAAQLFFEESGLRRGASIRLHKHLPLASGLGGGSSDAATTLLTLERMYGPTGLDLPRLALSLGADVPFFLFASDSSGTERAAFVSGIGEQLEPLSVPRTPLVLVNAGLEVSARDAYTWLDAVQGFTGPLPLEAILRALERGERVPYFNALQGPVLAHHPQLQDVLDALEGVGLHSPLMSGSGSTCFALAQDEAQAQAAAERLALEHPGWWVRAARTLG